MQQRELIILISIGLLLILYYNIQTKHPNVEKKSELSATVIFTNNWQTQHTSGGTFQLLNAYLDDRHFSTVDGKYYTVRIVGMLNSKTARNFHCLLRYDGGDVITVDSHLHWIWRENWEQDEQFYQPYVISCNTPDNTKPQSVSLVENDSSITNELEIQYQKSVPKNGFVVCVKGMNFPESDISIKLIEWIELLYVLGASKIHFYTYHIHPNIQKTLSHYIKEKKANVTSLFLVGNYSSDPHFVTEFLRTEKSKRRLQEVIPFNDCFYKYHLQYQYVLALDIDELIVPRSGNWFDLLQTLRAENNKADTFMARHFYFFDKEAESFSDIPNYLYFLRNVKRTNEALKEGKQVKGFHDTDKVLGLYNHDALWCWSKECNNVNIRVEMAKLQHYRGDCIKEVKNCEELMKGLVEDRGVWRFKKTVIERVEKVLDDLGM